MKSPYPFVRSFQFSLCEEAKNKFFGEKIKENEELKKKLLDEYMSWAEEELKGCPQFVRLFGRTMRYQGMSICFDEEFPLVPGHSYLEATTGAELSQLPRYEIISSFVKYKEFNKTLRKFDDSYAVYSEKTTDDNGNRSFQIVFSSMALQAFRDITGKDVRELFDFTDEKIREYVESVPREIESLFTKKRPSLRKPAETIQLEFDF